MLSFAKNFFPLIQSLISLIHKIFVNFEISLRVLFAWNVLIGLIFVDCTKCWRRILCNKLIKFMKLYRMVHHIHRNKMMFLWWFRLYRICRQWEDMLSLQNFKFGIIILLMWVSCSLVFYWIRPLYIVILLNFALSWREQYFVP